MIKQATKLTPKRHFCQANWATGHRTPCTQLAKYEIEGMLFCREHAKIRALDVLLRG